MPTWLLLPCQRKEPKAKLLDTLWWSEPGLSISSLPGLGVWSILFLWCPAGSPLLYLWGKIPELSQGPKEGLVCAWVEEGCPWVGGAPYTQSSSSCVKVGLAVCG